MWSAATEFNHGYTYSGHPVSCAVALENLRILEEEKIVDHVRDDVGPYLKEKWDSADCAPAWWARRRLCGMMGSIALTPNKETRAPFAADAGTVGLKCREHCFANNLVMRHVGDRMVISPPLVITRGGCGCADCACDQGAGSDAMNRSKPRGSINKAPIVCANVPTPEHCSGVFYCQANKAHCNFGRKICAVLQTYGFTICRFLAKIAPEVS